MIADDVRGLAREVQGHSENFQIFKNESVGIAIIIAVNLKTWAGDLRHRKKAQTAGDR